MGAFGSQPDGGWNEVKEQATGTPVDFDSALPHAQVLLEPEAVAAVLARSMRGSRSVASPRAPLDVRIRYLRYKPGTNLLVHYGVTDGGDVHHATGMVASGTSLARRVAKPENIALARLVAARAPAVAPLAYEEDVGCLVCWYPLDLSLPSLAIPPGELRRLLAGAGLAVQRSEGEPERLAYKPGRRAVLRVDGYILKLYAREEEFARALNGQRVASTLRTIVAPRLEAALPEHLITVQSALSGHTSSAAADLAVDAGAMLASLHASDVAGLRVVEPAAQLDAAAASARLVGAIAPQLRPSLKRLLAALEESRPTNGVLVPSHGDFTVRQLLVCGSGLAVADFDRFRRAPAALDLAAYAAYLVRGGADDLSRARAALADLVAGYGKRPANLDWYLATKILSGAPLPFRYFAADWRARVVGRVAAAKAALDS